MVFCDRHSGLSDPLLRVLSQGALYLNLMSDGDSKMIMPHSVCSNQPAQVRPRRYVSTDDLLLRLLAEARRKVTGRFRTKTDSVAYPSEKEPLGPIKLSDLLNLPRLLIGEWPFGAGGFCFY